MAKEKKKEQESRYYTPEPKDFYLGYEYEYRKETTKDWWKDKADHITFANGCWSADVERVRTKYLDKQDIESLGWKENEPQNMLVDMPIYAFYKSSINKYILLIDKNSIQIWYGFAMNLQENKWKTSHLYNGECKSINELRKIMEWLNIK